MRCRFILSAVCLLIVCESAGVLQAQPASLRLAVPRDGEPFDAVLTHIDATWNLTFDAGGEARVVTARDLVCWGEFRDSDRGSQFVLTDGSWLIGDVLQIGTEQLRAVSALWGEITLPLSYVRGVIFSPSVAPGKRDEIRRQMIAAAGGEDLLLLENGDEIAGTARSIAEEETSPGETSANLVFVTRGREVPLALNKITALIFNPSLAARTPGGGSHVLLGLADGTRLSVEKLALRDDRVQLILRGGVRLETDPPSLWEQLVWLQPIGTGVTYLSDLEPIGYKHIPLLTQTLPLGRDRSSRGGKLRAGGSLYAKGLGMPSASRAAYALQGKYRQFAADVVLSDQANRTGSVIFRVFLGDGNAGWSAAFESPPLRGGDPPLRVVVDTSGVQAMALIVDMAERGDVQDDALWLNARLIQQE